MPGAVYEPEIDGLRAIAILGVLFFHVGALSVSGGFVGVDVFFVISGFLITRLIVTELRHKKSFSFSRFYIRRIRRLFPALISTIAVAAIASVILFSPEQLKDFSKSSAAAVVSLSNVYFWSQADYFDAAAITKPLLHTWSLSIEEQFYLIWPALIVFMMRRFAERTLVVLIAAACVASVVVGQYWLEVDRDAAFYLLPTRVVELGIGALLVWLDGSKGRRGKSADLISLVGVALVAYACLMFTQKTRFPGLNALVPCLGAAMLIYGARGPSAGAVLRLPPLVWIGRISYSLYLVHWPVIVFYSAYTYRKPGLLSQWAIIGASIVLAWLQYRFIEERFRYVREESWPGRHVGMAAGATATVVLFTSMTIYASGGLPGRLPASRLAISDKEWREQQNKKYCTNIDPSMDPAIITCQNFRSKDKELFIWGDSHALHLIAGFSENYPEYNIYVSYLSACVPQSGFGGYTYRYDDDRSTQGCIKRNQEMLEFLLNRRPTNVVISSAKRSTPVEIAKATNAMVEALKEAGHNLAVLGDFIRPGIPLGDCFSVPQVVLSDQYVQDRCAGDAKAIASEIRYNRELSADLPYLINPNDIECPDGRCVFVNDEGPLFRDHHHLNIAGSVYYIGKVRDLLPFE